MRKYILSILLASSPALVDAALLKIEFSGTFDSGSSNPLVPAGTSYSGSFTYDSATAPFQTMSVFGTTYKDYALPGGQLTIGGVAKSVTAGASISSGSYNSARFFLRLAGEPTQVALGYYGLCCNPLPDAALPASPSFFADWRPSLGYTSITTAGSYSTPTVKASLISAVPEPQSWALLIGGFGLAGLALRRPRAIAAI